MGPILLAQSRPKLQICLCKFQLDTVVIFLPAAALIENALDFKLRCGQLNYWYIANFIEAVESECASDEQKCGLTSILQYFIVMLSKHYQGSHMNQCRRVHYEPGNGAGMAPRCIMGERHSTQAM